MKCERWTQEELQLLTSHYGNTLRSEMLALLPNRTARAICEKARTMGLSKSDACRQRLFATMLASPIRKEHLEKLRQSERRKWKADIPRRTRWHFSNQSETKRAYRYYMRKRGYIEIIGHKNVLYYTNSMKRHPKAEAGASRYGIKILQLPK